MNKPIDLGLRSRRGTYTLILGIVIGLLVAGLAIPFVFGTSLNTTGASSSSGLASPLAPANGSASSDGSGTGGGASGTAAGGSASGSAATSNGGATGDLGLLPNGVGGPGGSSGSASPAGLTASDRGVTATTITIAVLVVDLGGVSKVGFSVPGYDPKAQEQYDGAFIDNINNHGGILGRKIVPVYITYDPTNESSDDAACLAATQDHAVFAALDTAGALTFPAIVCLTQQNHTPLLTVGAFGTPQDMYRQANGNLFTVYASGLRSLANLASSLATAGSLKGKRIGILDRDFPGTVQTVTDGMVAILKQLGYTVTYRVDMSMDDGTASSQAPVAAHQMQANGVDTVMLLTDSITASEFVQSADKSAYRPEYIASDFEGMTNDTALQAMPSTFQGLAVTTSRVGEWRIGTPEPALDASCGHVYTAATGQPAPPRSNLSYAGIEVACGMVNLFARAASSAGPTLTRAGYTTALQQVGSLAFPFFGGVSYRPGKFDGADLIRSLVTRPSCICWIPVGSFSQPRY